MTQVSRALSKRVNEVAFSLDCMFYVKVNERKMTQIDSTLSCFLNTFWAYSREGKS